MTDGPADEQARQPEPGGSAGSGSGEAADAPAIGGKGGRWRRWGAAQWTIAVSSLFALAMVAVLVLLAVFRGRTGCGGQSAAPSASPSPSSSGTGTEACSCGGAGCVDPGDVCNRIVEGTCETVVGGCGGSGGGGSGTAPSTAPADSAGPTDTAGPGGDSTSDPTGPGGAPTGGNPTGGAPTGGDPGGGPGSGGDGCGGSGGDGCGGSGGSGCDSGSSGCDSGGSSVDCSGYAAGHGVPGSLLAAAPVVLTAPGVGARLGVWAVRAYQRWLSPRLAVRCRYTPTCSQYGLRAIQRYGLLAGARLTQARIRRCTDRVPPGTADPVPDPPVTAPRRR